MKSHPKLEVDNEVEPDIELNLQLVEQLWRAKLTKVL
jgi:hypothetical protein